MAIDSLRSLSSTSAKSVPSQQSPHSWQRSEESVVRSLMIGDWVRLRLNRGRDQDRELGVTPCAALWERRLQNPTVGFQTSVSSFNVRCDNCDVMTIHRAAGKAQAHQESTIETADKTVLRMYPRMNTPMKMPKKRLPTR